MDSVSCADRCHTRIEASCQLVVESTMYNIIKSFKTYEHEILNTIGGISILLCPLHKTYT